MKRMIFSILVVLVLGAAVEGQGYNYNPSTGTFAPAPRNQANATNSNQIGVGVSSQNQNDNTNNNINENSNIATQATVVGVNSEVMGAGSSRVLNYNDPDMRTSSGAEATSNPINYLGLAMNIEASEQLVSNPIIYHPPLLHVGPPDAGDKVKSWKAYDFNPMYLEGLYTQENVMRVLRNTGHLGAEWGRGFKVQALSFKRCSQTREVELICGAGKSPEFDVELLSRCERIGFVQLEVSDGGGGLLNLAGCAGKMVFGQGFDRKMIMVHGLVEATRKAMQMGGNILLFSAGGNYFNKSNVIGIGAVGAAADTEKSGGLTLGFSSGSTKADMDPVVNGVVLRLKRGSVGSVGQEILQLLQERAIAAAEAQAQNGNGNNGNGVKSFINLREKTGIIGQEERR